MPHNVGNLVVDIDLQKIEAEAGVQAGKLSRINGTITCVVDVSNYEAVQIRYIINDLASLGVQFDQGVKIIKCGEQATFW